MHSGAPRQIEVPLAPPLQGYNAVIGATNPEMDDASFCHVHFNASHLASGVYFYRMQAGNYTETRKLLLIR